MQPKVLSSPVRLALVGAGIFARDAHVPSLLRLPDNFEIVAVYSRTAATASALAAMLPNSPQIHTDLNALLADQTIEAVDVMLPIDVMASTVAQALASGKHVISEKPIAPDLATGRQLLNAYRQSSTSHAQQVWMVGENWRYEAAFLQAADFVRNGAIGRPITCHIAHYAPVLPTSKYYHSAWRRSGNFPGGYILDGGIHQVASLRLIVGEVAAVSAILTQVNPDLQPADTISATLHFANGALGTYLASYAVGSPWPAYLHVVGEKGSLRVLRGEIEFTSEGKTQMIKCEGFDGVQKELAAFATAIREGSPHRNSAEEALRDLAVVEAMLHAAESGQRVAVSQQ
ncbi:Gfo/Idh/MocA family oxidoreductase [soil metagenome]